MDRERNGLHLEKVDPRWSCLVFFQICIALYIGSALFMCTMILLKLAKEVKFLAVRIDSSNIQHLFSGIGRMW